VSDRYSMTDEECLLWNLLRGIVSLLWRSDDRKLAAVVQQFVNHVPPTAMG
jgi:hypothetical protein